MSRFHVTLSKFRRCRRRKQKVRSFGNRASLDFNWSIRQFIQYGINSKSNILRGCFLHCNYTVLFLRDVCTPLTVSAYRQFVSHPDLTPLQKQVTITMPKTLFSILFHKNGCLCIVCSCIVCLCTLLAACTSVCVIDRFCKCVSRY